MVMVIRRLAVICFLTGGLGAVAQPVEQLKKAYSGRFTWDTASVTLIFTGSGAISFANAGLRSFPTIKMIENSVPIQMGWGNYSDGAVANFNNLTVLGNGGRGNEGNAIISGRQGRYDVTVNIDGCHIENPNGTLVSLREDSMTLRGAITGARINLKSYAGEFKKGTNLLTVCGSREKRANYDCPVCAVTTPR